MAWDRAAVGGVFGTIARSSCTSTLLCTHSPGTQPKSRVLTRASLQRSLTDITPVGCCAGLQVLTGEGLGNGGEANELFEAAETRGPAGNTVNRTYVNDYRSSSPLSFPAGLVRLSRRLSSPPLERQLRGWEHACTHSRPISRCTGRQTLSNWPSQTKQ